ncbi:MerR family transcriptional regulator [Rhizobium sp. BR 315]|uniref:MerR family transcriptional regulator n=1 Tax=Rhizobium sp. BR 315 TaxID=3040014 RepID=UPI003D3349E4
MNIGELAKRTGLSSSRIRFYERAGLLTTVDRRPNGYRTYSPQAVLMLTLITTAQNAGFSLEEIRRLLPSDLERWQHDGLLEALRRKVADIEALEARLAENKAQLVSLIADIEAKPDDVDCATNARRILSHVVGQETESHLVGAGDIKPTGKASRRRQTKAG